MLYNNYLFSKRLPLMNRALDAYALRSRTIAKNIANANSPHYRPESVKFEEFFHHPEVVLKGSTNDNRHIPVGRPAPGSIQGEVHPQNIPEPQIYFSGETHVNVDREMSTLAETQIRFRFGAQMVKRFFTGLSNSITGSPGQ